MKKEKKQEEKYWYYLGDSEIPVEMTRSEHKRWRIAGIIGTIIIIGVVIIFCR